MKTHKNLFVLRHISVGFPCLCLTISYVYAVITSTTLCGNGKYAYVRTTGVILYMKFEPYEISSHCHKIFSSGVYHIIEIHDASKDPTNEQQQKKV